MSTEDGVLREAIAEVDRERSVLRAERCAFEEFRETVRLATPDAADDSGDCVTTERLLEAYREHTIEALDYGDVSEYTITESIEEELSPAIANVLTSDGTLTQRRKRNLLVATTEAVQRRERFLEELESEHTALKRFADELAEVESTIHELPECSLQEQPLEQLLECREAYDRLERCCERLLEVRQEADPGRRAMAM
jgi:hypothetical protein